MPIKKTLPYKTLVRNLIASKKLSEPERIAFEKMARSISEGSDIDQHQKLWIETLKEKYLSKH